MAILRRAAMRMTLVGACLSLGACSLIVDAESLEAERRDATDDSADSGEPSDSTPDDADTLNSNDIGEDVPDLSDGDASEDLDAADLSEVADVGDVVEIPDTTPDTVEPPAEELIVRHTGSAGCILDYQLQAVTNCPKACDWSFAFDASSSTGITSFNWSFSVTGGYGLTTLTGEGPKPSLSVVMPSCGFLDSVSVGPADLLVKISTNQRNLETFKLIPFAVRQVSQCPTRPRADCFGP